MNATRAAIDEGIVVGGGCALLYASTVLKKLRQQVDFDEQIGVKMVESACKVPLEAIVDNAGKDGATVVEQLLESNERSKGYDAVSHEIVDMKEKGIVDPTKVVRTALEDAASVASLMTTTEAMVVMLPEEKGGAPDMGGMGGGMY